MGYTCTHDLFKDSTRHEDPYGAAALHPHVDAAEQIKLEKIIFASKKLKLEFARLPYTPVHLLEKLADEGHAGIQLRVAHNPSTTSRVLALLNKSSASRDVRVAIASHRHADAKILANLPWQYHSEIKRALCRNANTGVGEITAISSHATLAQKKDIARNPATTAGLLQKLWLFKDEYLLAEIVAHPNCPPALLLEAQNSASVLMRRKLASNSNLKREMLMSLLKDTHPNVRAAATRNLLALKGYFEKDRHVDTSTQVRRIQARQQALPLDMINDLAVDSDPWVRRWTARNAGTPNHILRELAKDSVTEVRRGVARNPSCPEVLLKELAKDPSAWVKAGVALREDTPENILRKLAKEQDHDILCGIGKNIATPEEIVEDIAGHADKDVRRAVILNRNARAFVLEKLLTDPYSLNRFMLAQHPNLGEDALSALVQDPESSVRFMAVSILAKRLTEKCRDN